MNTLRSILPALSLVAILPLAAGCAFDGTESDSAEQTAENEGSLICTTCDNETPHDPPKHSDFVVLPNYTVSVGSDGVWNLYVTIKNQGTAAGWPGILGVAMGRDGQALWGTAHVSAGDVLQPGQSRVVSAWLGYRGDPNDFFCEGPYGLPCIGFSVSPYYVKLTADVYGDTFESNEYNNSTTINL